MLKDHSSYFVTANQRCYIPTTIGVLLSQSILTLYS
ncbi:hypothetical protein LINPERPRIM_LOCUS38665 [Linum perenne]